MYNKFLMALMIFGILILNSEANAETEIYEGVGEYYFDETKTLDEARIQAKLLAESDVLEKVEVFIASYSDAHNFQLTDDEIISISAGIIYMLDVKYDLSVLNDGIMSMKVTVTAEVDTDKIGKLLEREVARRLS